MFFTTDLSGNDITLEEETSKHIVQVLRMAEGEHLLFTDGKGQIVEAEITNPHRKHAAIKILTRRFIEKPSRPVTIAISLLKNASRFEWFLEKATELGTAGIIPMICERTEKQKFRSDRLQNICVSAMLQSL